MSNKGIHPILSMRTLTLALVAILLLGLSAQAQEPQGTPPQGPPPQGQGPQRGPGGPGGPRGDRRGREATTSTEKRPYKEWVKTAPRLSDAYMQTPEAVRVADLVMLYQCVNGGWPKNIYFPAELTDDERQAVVEGQSNQDVTTIDNDATTTEIHFLSRVYNATGQEKYRDAALRGIEYLLKSQYAHGGWPQFWPKTGGYWTAVTYNDDAMVNTMVQLRQIYEHQAPFAYVPDEVCDRARQAFERGVECILNTQIKWNGQLTVWCAQHDEVTLAPCKARAYELPSFSGSESVGIVELLMSLPDPSDRVVAAVEGAVAWFEAHKITGIHREEYTDDQGQRDYRMVPCPQDDYPCPTLWARFYTLEDCQPFFSDRDGVKRFDLSEIGHERRTGYGWYTTAPQEILDNYPKWKAEHGH